MAKSKHKLLKYRFWIFL